MNIHESINELIKEGGVEAVIKQYVEPQARKEREMWLSTLVEMRKDESITDEELKFINRQIYLLRKKLGISQTIDEVRQQWKIRNRRAYEKRKAKQDG